MLSEASCRGVMLDTVAEMDEEKLINETLGRSKDDVVVAMGVSQARVRVHCE